MKYAESQIGGHAMTIVGYDDNIWVDVNGNGVVDSGEMGAFKLANSWGATYANSGFIWVAYDAFLATSIVPGIRAVSNRIQFAMGGYAYLMSYRPYSPRYLARVKLQHAKRNQISLTFSTAPIPYPTPQNSWSPFAFLNKGGGYTFDGGNFFGTFDVNNFNLYSTPGTFYFDISNLITGSIDKTFFYLTLGDSSLDKLPLIYNKYEILDWATGSTLYSASFGYPGADGTDGYSVTNVIGNLRSSAAIPKGLFWMGNPNSIALYWSPVDTKSYSRFYIYRNGIKIGEVSSAEYKFVDYARLPSGVYFYQVSAVTTSGYITTPDSTILQR